MTYGEAKAFIGAFLHGDNNHAEATPQHFKAAMIEVAIRCEPEALISHYDGTQSDVLRFLHRKEDQFGETVRPYIKEPAVSDPLDESAAIGVDNALHMAVVYFVCAYLSNKSADRYAAKGKEICDIYTDNLVPEGA